MRFVTGRSVTWTDRNTNLIVCTCCTKLAKSTSSGYGLQVLECKMMIRITDVSHRERLAGLGFFHSVDYGTDPSTAAFQYGYSKC